jgi:hypothetical protein
VLTLEKARELFLHRGFDMLIAEAAVVSAEGDFATASALPNPGVSLLASKNFGCMSAQDCNTRTYSVGLADNNLISNFATGKRGLRKDFAGAALEAARRSRDDAREPLTGGPAPRRLVSDGCEKDRRLRHQASGLTPVLSRSRPSSRARPFVAVLPRRREDRASEPI